MQNGPDMNQVKASQVPVLAKQILNAHLDIGCIEAL